ncbi:MAG: hypothetical protein AAF682_03985 [Planctomycetota bacterium]
MPDAPKYAFRNVTRRPIELCLEERVVLLPPGEAVLRPADDRLCQALAARGVLTRHEAPSAAAEPRQKPASKRARRKSSKSSKSSKTAKAAKASKATKSSSRSRKSTRSKRA